PYFHTTLPYCYFFNFPETLSTIIIDETQPVIITTAYNDEQHTSDKVCRNVIKPINLENLLEGVMFCVGGC
ncbi:MAG: hypothetical protein H7844_15990, partial [Nitrospirae bacterium YQR-1]